MHKYHYCGYHFKNFGDRDLSIKSTISELAPIESTGIQYGMDLKTAGPPKVVEHLSQTYSL